MEVKGEITLARVKGFASSLAILMATVSTLAIITGLVGFLVFSEAIEREASLKIVEVALVFDAVSVAIFALCRKHLAVELVDAFLVVSVFWILAPLFSAALYSYTIHMPFLDALFESVSGFSGTGLTVIDKPESLPRVILIWRALTQWVGELGVVVISGVLLPFLHRSIRSIYVVERGARLAPTIISTTRKLFTLYVVYTTIGVLLFVLSGMPLMDSIAHSMTAIATGGMSTNSENLGYWFRAGNNLVVISASIMMVLGALNFMDLYNLSLGRLREFVKSIEVRGFATIFLVFLALLGTSAIAINSTESSFWTWTFHMLSGLTTTGFSITPIGDHPDVVKVILVLSMVVGGSTFSTAGGIKIKRAIVLAKSLLWEPGKIFIPKSVVVVRRVGSEVVKEEELISVYSYVVLYALTLVIISVLLHLSLLSSGLTNFSYIDSLFETASALSCVGLSSGITSSSAPVVTKALLMVAMYLGRIEFLPLYTLVGLYYISKITL
ncbi:MAG: potassium transporter TrkG [Sulfolobales archaeon]